MDVSSQLLLDGYKNLGFIKGDTVYELRFWNQKQGVTLRMRITKEKLVKYINDNVIYYWSTYKLNKTGDIMDNLKKELNL